MSVRKLTIIGLLAHGAVTTGLIIISAVSGAGLFFYLLAAAYALTGLFFYELITSRVLIPAGRCAASLKRLEGHNEGAVSEKIAHGGNPDPEEIATRMEAHSASVLASRDELTSLLGSLPLAVMETDSASGVTFTNDAATELTGFSPTEIIGRPFLTLFSNESLEGTKALSQRVYDGCGTILTRLDVVTKDGQTLSIDAGLMPLRQDGRVIGLRCVMLKTSDTLRLTARLNDAISSVRHYGARLEKAERDLEQFALIAIRRELKMQEIRERLQIHEVTAKHR